MRRQFFTPGWIARHLIALVLAGTCLALGWWQMHRAEGGNVLSWGYMIQWPAFALFIVFFWYKLIRFERNPPDVEPVKPPPPPPPPPPEVDESDPELAAYNRYLASLYEQDQKQ